MSRRYYQDSRSPSAVFVPMPVDRGVLGEKKVEALQRQIERLENDQMKRKELIEKLSKNQDKNQRKHQEKLLEKYNKKNILTDEIERIYGDDKGRNFVKSPASPRVLETVMAKRTKEFSMKQQEKELETKYLLKERERLQMARDRIREQRRALLSPADSSMSEPDYHYRSNKMADPHSRMSVRTPRYNDGKEYSVDSYVQNTINTLPETMDRIAQLRQDVQKHYVSYEKPYRGEMGIQTYLPHQMKGYFMVRGIVDDLVNDFLNLQFPEAVPMMEKDAYYATIEQRKRVRQQTLESMSERKAVQLLMEDIILDVTGEMCLEVAQEDRHSTGTIQNMVDLIIMNRAEAVATQNEEGRLSNDKAYNVVTKQYYTSQETRDSRRPDLFYHTANLSLKPEADPQRRIKLPPGVAPPPTVDGKGKKLPPAKTDIKGKKDKKVVPGQPPPSQPVRLPTPAKIPEEITVVLEREDPDTVVLEYHPIIPVDIRKYDPLPNDLPETKAVKERYNLYSQKEIHYWKQIIPYISELKMPKRVKGISIVSCSPNSKYVAFGSLRGDAMIFDTAYDPWRLIKVMVNENKGDDPIVNLSWTMDCQRVITITHSGSVFVYSMLGGLKKSNTSRMGLGADDLGVFPQQMGLVLDMDASFKDFTFQEGPLADDGVLTEVHLPTSASFFPSFSFLGVQDSFCVGLESGDILKCDLEFVLNAPGEGDTHKFVESKRVYNPMLSSKTLNIIGRGVEGDLFKQHKARIIHFSFIDNINELVSVDEEGFIFIWKYTREWKASVGWFKPVRKFRLSKTKDMYQPAEGKPKDRTLKLVFTDGAAAMPNKKRQRTRQEIAQERKQNMNLILNMNLGDPWHVQFDGNKLIEVYAPRGVVKDTGAVFHIVIKHIATDQLSSYATRVYKPVKIKYSKMSVISTAKGDALIFMLLFPSFPPKEPHVTITVFDLKTFELRDFRRDIYLSEAEFTEMSRNDTTFADISRVFGPTGSEYLFICLLGDFKVISLTTGRQVVRMEDPSIRSDDDDDEDEGYRGCTIRTDELPLEENSQVSVLSTNGKMHAIFHSPNSGTVMYVEFEDENVKATRRQMWKLYDRLEPEKKRLMPAELRVDTLTSDLGDKQHPSVAMRSIVLEMMDKAIQLSHKAKYTNEQKDDFMLWDRVNNYKPLEQPINSGNILTGP
ncbi:uncharacterized protein LOC128179715 isoform X1 [Crassostrea angulata]|uniref:uncharacterized protein LOC128179715 isoform X1 n=1 Tax=Magallana angulata TaxID=2784310 RepID=UPI0022B089A4|nr:uncharacterized protein LOC128179715 isoform X1 [Crassostrea angulata]